MQKKKKKSDNYQSGNPCQEEEVENKKWNDSDKDDDGKQASRHMHHHHNHDCDHGEEDWDGIQGFMHHTQMTMMEHAAINQVLLCIACHSA
jgi:hypothetical protein